MLVISGPQGDSNHPATKEFQSRNRDACHFRSEYERAVATYKRICFNLAIEMLVISGTAANLSVLLRRCFNLAIEMLVISGGSATETPTPEGAGFQSRNRDACHFRRKFAISI